MMKQVPFAQSNVIKGQKLHRRHLINLTDCTNNKMLKNKRGNQTD